MTDFFLRLPGELTADDRIALDRPGFKLYEHGDGVTEAVAGEPPRDLAVFHVIRVAAGDRDKARQEIVSALGREPEGLEIMYEL